LSETQFVKVDRSDHIATITLNRPEALNAISGALATELANACREVSEDRDSWVVVLGAEGEKAFCVGADLKERASFSTDDYFDNRKQMTSMFGALRALPQPAIASVFGFALGGGFELALSCDLIVAAEGTQLGLPEMRVGLLPAGGGTQLLARRTGLAVAKELIYTARRFPAEEGVALGVVSKVVGRDDLDDATLNLAREIRKASPIAARSAKRALDASLGQQIEDGVEFENDMWREVITSEDRAEGIAAFNDKREPKWSNR
jgi:enoyl-CoA hydratase/carnithine racemase